MKINWLKIANWLEQHKIGEETALCLIFAILFTMVVMPAILIVLRTVFEIRGYPPLRWDLLMFGGFSITWPIIFLMGRLIQRWRRK